MKRDINLLECLSEGEKKKSSSTGSLIMVVGVLLIVGVMLFMFFSTNMEIKDKEELLSKLEQELGRESEIVVLEQKIASDKARYQAMVQEIVKEVYSGKAQDQSAEISSKFIEVVYDNYARQKDADGKNKVMILSLNIDHYNVNMSCQTRSWEEAWAFIRYLEGNATEVIGTLPEGATDTEIADYNAKKAVIEKNKEYFVDVLNNYPGLPTEGKGEEYEIGFTLNFKVNWEAMAL